MSSISPTQQEIDAVIDTGRCILCKGANCNSALGDKRESSTISEFKPYHLSCILKHPEIKWYFA